MLITVSTSRWTLITLCPNTRCWLISIFYIACLQFQFSKTMNFLLAAHYMLCKHFNTEVICWETNIFQEQYPSVHPKLQKPAPKWKAHVFTPFVFLCTWDFLWRVPTFKMTVSIEINLRSIFLNNFMNEIKFTITYCVPFREPRLIQVSYFKSYHHVFIRNFFVHCF